MKKTKTIAARFSVVLAALLWLVTATAEAATIKLICGAKDTIGNALKKLKPGDTLSVTVPATKISLYRRKLQE